jgi:DNA invertase Pin-like site-specific DNA recombinase
VSGPSQIDGQGFPVQLENIESFCAVAQITIRRIYREEAVPGKLGEEDRPAFAEMVSDLLGNGCKTVVIQSLDRFAREYVVQQHLATYLASKGLTLISANTGEDITAALMGDPMRRALVQIQGVLSELDKNMTETKLRKARQRIKQHGRPPGAKNYSPDPTKNFHSEGRHPYGWKPGEAPILRQMLTLKGLGMTCKDIAKKLNSEGIPTRGILKKNSEGVMVRIHKPWRGSVVSKILAREGKANLCAFR